MPDTATDWQPEPKPVPAELTDNFPHATYPAPATHFPTISDRLDEVMRQRLLDLKGVL